MLHCVQFTLWLARPSNPVSSPQLSGMQEIKYNVVSDVLLRSHNVVVILEAQVFTQECLQVSD